MTTDQLALLADARLSTDARIVALYVAGLGEGEHEVGFRALARLLNQAGEKRVRRAVQDAADLGWLTRREGGRGHSPLLSFTPAEVAGLTAEGAPDSPAEAADLSDSSAASAHLNPDRSATAAHLNGAPSSPTSSPPPAAARGREGTAPPDDLAVARLRALLAPYDEPLDRLRLSTGTSAWAAEVCGWYAPPDEQGKGHGTQGGDFSGLSRDEGIQALAAAIGDFASDGRAWDRRLFRGFARNAGREARKAKAQREREREAREATAEVHQVRSETPGVTRGLHRTSGSAPLAGISELVAANLRKVAEQKAGEGASPERVEEELAKLEEVYRRNHLTAAGGAR